MSNNSALVMLRRHAWLVLICATIGVAAGGLVGLNEREGFSSQSRVYASNALADSASINQQTVGVQRMGSYEQLATGTALAARIVRRLGLNATPEDVASSLKVQLERGTVVMRITATAPSAERAENVLRVLPEELGALLSELSPPPGPNVPVTKFANVDGPTTGPARAMRRVLSLAAAGAVFGTVAGLLLLLLNLKRNPVLRSPELLMVRTGGILAGELPTLPMSRSGEMPPRPALAAHRLALSVQGQLELPPHAVLAVAGTRGAAGASVVASSLAQAFHQRGRHVLVVQADPEGPEPGGGTFGHIRTGANEPWSALPDSPPEQGQPGGAASASRTARNGALQPLLLDLREPIRDEGVLSAELAEREISGARRDFDLIIVSLPVVAESCRASVLYDYADGAVLVFHGTSRLREISAGLQAMLAVCPAPCVLVRHENHVRWWRRLRGN